MAGERHGRGMLCVNRPLVIRTLVKAELRHGQIHILVCKKGRDNRSPLRMSVCIVLISYSTSKLEVRFPC
jgi:hypothetical protein